MIVKQFTGNKSSSAAVFVTITAIALIGFSVIAIKNNGSGSYLHKRQMLNKNKIAAFGNQIAAISAENAALRQNMELLSASLDKMAIQNEKLLTTNNALALALEKEHDRSLNLMSVVSEESVEKLALSQKLDEANGKLLMSEGKNSKVHIA